MHEMCSVTTDHIQTEAVNVMTGARSQLLDILKRASTKYKIASKDMDDKRAPELRPRPSLPGPHKSVSKSISVNELQMTVRTRPQTSGLGLRRVRDSLHDLRIANQKHAHHQYKRIANSPKTLRVSKPLHRRQSSASLVMFEYDGAKQEKRTPYKSYQDLHILSMYEEEEDHDRQASAAPRSALPPPSQLRNMSLPHSAPHHAVSSPSLYSSSSGSSSPRPQTPLDDVRVPAYDWEDTDCSDNEHLRGRYARCVQVVQQHRTRDAVCHDDNEIMLATVLVGPGKPKLVQIPRPPSSTALLSQLSGSEKISTSRTSGDPTTPTHETSQASRFSPWDTPRDSTPFSDMSTVVSAPITVTRRPLPRSSICTDFSSSDQNSTPISSKTGRVSVDTKSDFDQSQSGRQLDDPFSSPRSHRSAYTNCGSSMIVSPVQTSPAISRTRTHEMVGLENMRKQRLKNAITASARILDVLSYHNLHLLTPELAIFREVLPEHNDEKLLTNLQRVFPNSSSIVLSTLAAWLIVDQYLTQLLGQKLQRLSSARAHDRFREYARGANIPNTLWSSHTTPQLSQACQNYWGRLNSIQRTPSSCYPPLSSACSTSILGQQHLYHNHVRSPAISVPASSESSGYSTGVPNKAKTVLGIGIRKTSMPSAAVAVETEIQCLEHRVKSVHESLGEIGQNLVGDWLTNSQQHGLSSLSKESQGSSGSVSDMTADGKDKKSQVPNCMHQRSEREKKVAASAALWQACRAITSLIAEIEIGSRTDAIQQR